MMFTA